MSVANTCGAFHSKGAAGAWQAKCTIHCC